MVFIKVLEKFLYCVYLLFLEHPSPEMHPFCSDRLIFFISFIRLCVCVLIKKTCFVSIQANRSECECAFLTEDTVPEAYSTIKAPCSARERLLIVFVLFVFNCTSTFALLYL